MNQQIGSEFGSAPSCYYSDKFFEWNKSTIICPVTTKINSKTDILRIRLSMGNFGLFKSCDIMPDQIRAIDNSRMIKKIVLLSDEIKLKLKKILELY